MNLVSVLLEGYRRERACMCTIFHTHLLKQPFYLPTKLPATRYLGKTPKDGGSPNPSIRLTAVGVYTPVNDLHLHDTPGLNLMPRPVWKLGGVPRRRLLPNSRVG